MSSDNIEQPRQDVNDTAVRFPAWVALAILSFVSFASVVGREHVVTSAENWAITVTLISSILGLITTIGYMYGRGIFLSQLPEVILAGLTLLLWCIGLPIIMNPKDSIAVSYTQVVNANLYFGSWTAFFCILWISANLAKLLYGVDIAARASPLIKSRRGKWYALVAASIVVMCSSIRVFKAFQCSTDEMLKAPTCKQTKYAISAGVLGTVESALCTLWQANYGIGRVHERVAAFLMVIIWALGLIFITFGEGPGHSIGNLYFATWASFILSVLIFAECLNEYLGVQQQASDPSSELPPHETTIEDLSMDIGVVENVDL